MTRATPRACGDQSSGNPGPASRAPAESATACNPADEASVDESLKDTFPASDAPAGRYVDIPSNRRDVTH